MQKFITKKHDVSNGFDKKNSEKTICQVGEL